MICVLMQFIAIAASRRANKDVNTNAVIRAKPGTKPGVHSVCLYPQATQNTNCAVGCLEMFLSSTCSVYSWAGVTLNNALDYRTNGLYRTP